MKKIPITLLVILIIISAILILKSLNKENTSVSTIDGLATQTDNPVKTIDDFIATFQDRIDSAPGILIENNVDFDQMFFDQITVSYGIENIEEKDKDFESIVKLASLEILKAYASKDPKQVDISDRLLQMNIISPNLTNKVISDRNKDTLGFWKKIEISESSITFFLYPAESYPYEKIPGPRLPFLFNIEENTKWAQLKLKIADEVGSISTIYGYFERKPDGSTIFHDEFYSIGGKGMLVIPKVSNPQIGNIQRVP